MREQLSLLRAQVDDLLEGRKGKLFKLKRAVRTLYDTCQNVPSPPTVDVDEILSFNLTKLSAIEASSDAFFFREINQIPDLRESLEELDQAAQDAQDDLVSLFKMVVDSRREEDFISVAEQLKSVYLLSGKCDQMLQKIV